MSTNVKIDLVMQTFGGEQMLLILMRKVRVVTTQIFFVCYEDCDDDQSGWYLVPLKEDYLKGWVRFVDIE